MAEGCAGLVWTLASSAIRFPSASSASMASWMYQVVESTQMLTTRVRQCAWLAWVCCWAWHLRLLRRAYSRVWKIFARL